MCKIYIVFNLLDEFMNDQFKSKSYMNQFPGGYIMPLISEYLEGLGYRCISYDKYMELSIPKKGFLITDMSAKKNTRIPDNLIPLIAYSLESPLYSALYYSKVSWYSRKYLTLMDWEGVSAIHPKVKSKLVPMKWPCYRDRKILGSPKVGSMQSKVAFISTNKKSFNFSPPRSSFFQFLKYCLFFVYIISLKTTRKFRSCCLYNAKMKVLKSLLDGDLVDIYGRGWDKSIFFKQYPSSIMGPNKDKQSVICNYKFSLCIENMSFPGYLTEKIYDSLFAFSIPIYLGDPEIDKKIPKNCYIDLRDFSNYNDLVNYLKYMPDQLYDDYILNIKKFVDSYETTTFTCKQFASLISNQVKNYL